MNIEKTKRIKRKKEIEEQKKNFMLDIKKKEEIKRK